MESCKARAEGDCCPSNRVCCEMLGFLASQALSLLLPGVTSFCR